MTICLVASAPGIQLIVAVVCVLSTSLRPLGATPGLATGVAVTVGVAVGVPDVDVAVGMPGVGVAVGVPGVGDGVGVGACVVTIR